MAYHFERLYELYLFLGDPDSAPLWDSQVWSSASSLLDPLVFNPRRGSPAVFTVQFSCTSPPKPLRFGRIAWTSAGHSKWTHHKQTKAEFIQTQLWCPGPTNCQRQDRPPDFFLSLHNMGRLAQRPTFRDTLLLATAIDEARLLDHAREAARKLATIRRWVFRGRRLRPWALPFGSGAFTDSVQEMPSLGVFKLGPVVMQPPTKEILSEDWDAW